MSLRCALQQHQQQQRQQLLYFTRRRILPNVNWANGLLSSWNRSNTTTTTIATTLGEPRLYGSTYTRALSTTTSSSAFNQNNSTTQQHPSSPPPSSADEFINDYAMIPPEFPLPIITPKTTTTTAIATGTGTGTGTTTTAPTNDVTTSTTTARTDGTPPTPSFTQQLQHAFQKNISIPYQQNIIVQGETLFQSILQQSTLPYVGRIILYMLWLCCLDVSVSIPLRSRSPAFLSTQ
jgi:hypothetical protein